MQAAENLPEAVSRVLKANTEEVTENEASEACPILIFATQNGLNLAKTSLHGGARGFVYARMTPEQVLRVLSVAAEGELAAPRELLESLIV